MVRRPPRVDARRPGRAGPGHPGERSGETIPPVRELLSACEFLARRFGWDLGPHDDELIHTLVECRLEVERLRPSPEDEAAVMFHVFAAESARLGEDYVSLLVIVTLNHAMATGRRPAVEPRVLTQGLVRWAREIAGGVGSLDAFGAWFDIQLPQPPG